jgi:hypothetical protein
MRRPGRDVLDLARQIPIETEEQQMRRMFTSLETEAFLMEDMTCNANTELGDPGAC